MDNLWCKFNWEHSVMMTSFDWEQTLISRHNIYLHKPFVVVSFFNSKTLKKKKIATVEES